MDEHRIGLKPVRRRVWGRRGERPRASVRPRYQWLYLSGFVEPQVGETAWWLMPTVSVHAFSAALAAFARARGAGQGIQGLLVLDRAGWHLSPKGALPAGVHLLALPAYSPELQPAERLWTLTNEALANRYFDTLDALEQAQATRCLALQDWPAEVRAVTRYHGWPDTSYNY